MVDTWFKSLEDGPPQGYSKSTSISKIIAKIDDMVLGDCRFTEIDLVMTVNLLGSVKDI